MTQKCFCRKTPLRPAALGPSHPGARRQRSHAGADPLSVALAVRSLLWVPCRGMHSGPRAVLKWPEALFRSTNTKARTRPTCPPSLTLQSLALEGESSVLQGETAILKRRTEMAFAQTDAVTADRQPGKHTESQRSMRWTTGTMEKK